MFNDFFIYSAEALALAGNGETTFRTNIENDSDFEIFDRVATAISQNYRVKMAETSSGRQMHDAALAGASAFGDGRRPFRLPVSKRLKRASTLITTFRDESGAANEIRAAYIGAKVFKRRPFPIPEYVAREAFDYTAPFVETTGAAADPDGAGTIPASGTGIFNIRIQEDADFEIRKLTITHNLAALPAGSSSIATIRFADETYGYAFMDRPIPVESLGAAVFSDASRSGMYAFRLRVPKLMRHASVLSVTIRNLDTVNALRIRVTFHGAKLYSSQPVGGA